MSGLYGSSVKNPNYILRFSLIVFVGIILFGAVASWKAELLFASEYQELPVTHEQLKIKKENQTKQQKMQTALQKKLLGSTIDN